MSTSAPVATAIAVLLLLSACTRSAHPTTHHPVPSPTVSRPAFLASDQGEIDRLPEGAAGSVRIEPDSTRYQGSWDNRRVFLAVKAPDSVCLVMTLASDPDKWTAACGDGNGVVTDELPDGATAKYLPMVTKTAPEGWTRLSDYVFVM